MSTEQLQEAGFAASHYDQMTKMRSVQKLDDPLPHLANSSGMIELSNYISRQSSQRDHLTQTQDANTEGQQSARENDEN